MNATLERQLLQQAGATEIEYDSRINNYRIDFMMNGEKQSIEHILNVYGSQCDYWETDDYKTFDSLEEVIAHIKNRG